MRLGYACTQELEQQVCERMEWLGLRADKAALLTAVGIVREWVKLGKQELALEDLERVLEKCQLYQPKDVEWGIPVYLLTIKTQKFDIEPDYLLDWRDYFEGSRLKTGHQLRDPSAWNTLLLPELEAMAERINQETDCRLIRARGLARLSAWFAFGVTFSEVARYTIEVDQGGHLWRTDAAASPDFALQITSNGGSIDGERLDGAGGTVAVGISVTGSLEEDVRAHLASRAENVAALLLLQPNLGLGRDSLRSSGDVVALAYEAKRHIRLFVKQWHATRLLLFYFGPLSGACFIGHSLNAVCQEIQIMEDQQPGYATSFLLR